MSKISKAADILRKEEVLKPTTNFMGGTSYKLDPIQSLRMIAASSIFGEPQYYRASKTTSKCGYDVKRIISFPDIIPDMFFKTLYDGRTVEDVFTTAIDAALEHDFYATLRLAVELRHQYNMRLNPQIIMVRAAIHPARKAFTKVHHGVFAEIERQVMRRADEPAMQVAYYIFLTGSKEKMPSILKRAIAEKLSTLTPYEINKYKNAEIGMVDTIRIVHAYSPALSDLIYDRLTVDDEERTWEQLRSEGKTWKEILSTITLGHMALLRNLRNIFMELSEEDPGDKILAENVIKQLLGGVPKGRQFPFRYESAFKRLENETFAFKVNVLDALDECIDIAVNNLPHLKGKTVALTDNSGSAWGALTSEYGTTKIAEIDNLSSVIAVRASDSGYVIKFGDTAKRYDISRRNGILSITKQINEYHGQDVGTSTEGGIWEYLNHAIETKEMIDNLFIFSDCQAGTGELYGTSAQSKIYAEKYAYKNHKGWDGVAFIDVYKLIKDYRQKVNPKVNVFCVQTAGYDNTLLPQYSYRFAALTGWTGKEVLFASKYIEQWDGIESNNNSNT